MLSTLILIFGIALANRIWGGLLPKFGREIAVILVALIATAGLYFKGISLFDTPHHAFYFGLAIGLFYLFGRAWGLDIYFCCFNPTLLKQSDIGANKGEKWINAVCNKLIPNLMQQSDFKKRLWGFIGMSLRAIYFMPMILILTLISANAILIAPLCLLMGFVYAMQYYQPQSWWYKQYQLPAAELLYGAVLGGLIALAI